MMTLFLVCIFLWAAGLTAQAQRADNYRPDNSHVGLHATNLPIVFIDVGGREIQRDERITARMKIIDNGAGRLNHADTLQHPSQHIDYEGWIGLRYRGFSSFLSSDKKPYSLRTLAVPIEQGDVKEKVRLLGMGRDSNWALLAPYADKSFMRDVLAFELSRPWMEYVPEARFCELVLDGTYYGIYILCELYTNGKNRLNLDDPGHGSNSITGGYIMEVDRADDHPYNSAYNPVNDVGTPVRWITLQYKYEWPAYDELSDDQRDYITTQVAAMEDAFASPQYTDPQTGYRQYIDTQSFIDYQLATEVGHNVDGYRLSGKFYKRRDSHDPRFHMALWDMNLAYGNADYYDGWRNDSWAWRDNSLIYRNGDRQMPPFWWYKLNTDPLYLDELKARWYEYRISNFSDEHVVQLIDSMATLLTACGAEERNTQAWPRWGKYVWPNYYVAPDFDSEIAHLKQWLLQRMRWMDTELEYHIVGISAPTAPTPASPYSSAAPGVSRRLVGIYTPAGVLLAAPRRGLNIFRYSDGTAQVVLSE